MSIDIFWSGFVVGVMGLTIAMYVIDKIIYPRVKRKSKR